MNPTIEARRLRGLLADVGEPCFDAAPPAFFSSTFAFPTPRIIPIKLARRLLFLAGRVGGGVSAAVEKEEEEIGFVVGRGGGSSNEATGAAAKGSVLEARIGLRWGILYFLFDKFAD